MTASAALVEPAFCTHPPYTRTFGPEVADLASLAGFAPDDEQRLALDLIFAMQPGGRPLTLECALCIGRQNLKTGVLKMAVLGKLFVLEQRLVTWSAHEFATSAEAFRDLKELIEGCSYLDRRIAKLKEGHGDESIELIGGQRVVFKTRTKSGGRGLTGDTVIMDEAMYLAPSHMGSLFPTLSARPEPQVLYGGSAGLAQSSVWWELRKRGRVGGDPSLVWLEWCDDLPGECATPQCAHRPGVAGCRLDDEARWVRANTTLGKRITVEYVRGERRALPPEEFARERLGWWDEVDVAEKPIPTPAWAALALDLAEPPAGPRHFLLDSSPGLVSSSIAVAVDRDGVPHLELADHGSGGEWMVARAAELRDRYPGCVFAMFADSAASALLTKLHDDADIDPHLLTGQDMGRACAHLQQLVAGAGLTHSGDVLFAQALAGAVKRDIGDGMWGWSRRKSADISPIVAATGAAWLLETRPAYDPLDSVY